MPGETLSSSVCVIQNPNAGSADQIDELKQLISDRSDLQLCKTDRPGHGKDMAIEHCQTGDRIIAAAGGDGTISEIVNGLMDSDCDHKPAILVIPMGTGNDLARTLGIEDIEHAVSLLDDGEIRPLDVMRWSATLEDGSEKSGWSVNVMAAGFSSKIQETLTSEMKSRWGPLAYYRAAIGAAASLDPHSLRLTVDGEQLGPLDVLNTVIANARYAGGGVMVAPEADVSDGELDFVAVRDGSALEIAGLSARFLIGSILDSDQIVHIRGKHFELESDPPLPFNVDGDKVGSGKLIVEVKPGALKVVVPKATED